MLKRLVFSLVFIILGVLLAAVLLLNPLEWGWLQPVQYAIYHAAAGDDGHNQDEAETSVQLWTCGMHPQVIQDEPGECPICGMDLTPLQTQIDVNQIDAHQGHDHSGEAETPGQLWTCGMHPQVIQDEPGDCPICGMDLTPLKDSGTAVQNEGTGEKKIKHWVAPMDPNFVSDKPGKSPMGMDLVPVYEENQPGSGAVGVVHIDPSFVQNIGVQWVDVERRDIPVSIRTIGTVAYNDRRISLVNIKYSGWIEDVQVNYVGESVRKGQKLFEIYSPDLVTTQKEYLNALDYAKRMNEGNYPDIRKRAESLLESSRERLRNWDLTPGQIEELESSRQPRRTITVFSPADGVVISKMDQSLEGMYVKPGMNLYKIADLATVWVEAEIFESQLPLLKVGQRASLDFPSLPGKKYRGTIRYMYPFLDQKSRTMKVSIEIANPGLMLRKDMYADVTFDVPSANQVLTVPEDSVIHSGRRNVVVLSLGEGAFQVREVELGINGDHVWEVKQGIMEGDKVVTSSQFLIDSESNLRAAIQKTIAARARKGEFKPAAGNSKPGAEDENSMPAGHVH